MECTIRVLLQGVRDEATVVGAGGDEVGDPVIIVVVVTLIPEAISISVQLRAVNDRWAVIARVLVSITVAGQRCRRNSNTHGHNYSS